MMLLALLLSIADPPRLIPEAALIGQAADRVKDPTRDPLPADPALAAEIRRGYQLFVDTPKHAPQYAYAKMSCGNCHLNAGQKEGAMPLVGIAAVFPEYNRRAGRTFVLEDRIVG